MRNQYNITYRFVGANTIQVCFPQDMLQVNSTQGMDYRLNALLFIFSQNRCNLIKTWVRDVFSGDQDLGGNEAYLRAWNQLIDHVARAWYYVELGSDSCSPLEVSFRFLNFPSEEPKSSFAYFMAYFNEQMPSTCLNQLLTNNMLTLVGLKCLIQMEIDQIL